MTYRDMAARISMRAFNHSFLIHLFSIAFAVPLFAGDWPAFRGPNGDGIAADGKPPIHFNASTNLLWKIDLPRGHSSPVIWAGRIFITGADGNELLTFCFDRRSGKKLWECKVTAEKLEKVHETNSLASATPVTDGKAVYVYFGSFGVIAYDFAGTELWRKSLPIPATVNNQGSASSPILAENKLVLFIQNGNDSQLLALNPADGTEVWKHPLPLYNMSWSTPVTWNEDGKGRIGMICAKRFTAFQLSDGEEVWWLDGLSYQACSTPVVAGDRLMISAAGIQGEPDNVISPPGFDEALKKFGDAGKGKIAYDSIPADMLMTDRHNSDGGGDMKLKQALAMFFRLKTGDKLDREQWEKMRTEITKFATGPINRTIVLCAKTGGKGDASESNIVWKETKGVPEVPSPLLWQGRIYLIRSGGLLVCRDAETGKLIYEERIDAPGGYFASPTLADGRIYFCSDRGAVTVVKAGDSFEALARNELNDPIFASPAAVENTLYVRSTGHLWAFGENSNDEGDKK